MSEDMSNDLPNEADLVLNYAGKLTAAEADLASEKGRVSGLHAQAQNVGLDLDALKGARKIAKKRDDKISAAEKTLVKTALYLRILYPQAFSQVSFDEHLSAMNGPLEGDQAIFDEGRRAGLMSTAAHCPAGYNDQQRDHWDEGWREGNQQRLRIEEMAATIDDEEHDDLEDTDLDDEPLDEADEEPSTDVVDFADQVEVEASEEEPDLPESLDRKNWVNGQPPSTTGSGFEVEETA